jgi:hypothetical protein
MFKNLMFEKNHDRTIQSVEYILKGLNNEFDHETTEFIIDLFFDNLIEIFEKNSPYYANRVFFNIFP